MGTETEVGGDTGQALTRRRGGTEVSRRKTRSRLTRVARSGVGRATRARGWTDPRTHKPSELRRACVYGVPSTPSARPQAGADAGRRLRVAPRLRVSVVIPSRALRPLRGLPLPLSPLPGQPLLAHRGVVGEDRRDRGVLDH